VTSGEEWLCRSAEEHTPVAHDAIRVSAGVGARRIADTLAAPRDVELAQRIEDDDRRQEATMLILWCRTMR